MGEDRQLADQDPQIAEAERSLLWTFSNGRYSIAVYETDRFTEVEILEKGQPIGRVLREEEVFVAFEAFNTLERAIERGLGPGPSLEGSFHWQYVPARCLDSRLRAGDSVKIAYLGGTREKPDEIVVYPDGRPPDGQGSMHMVVQRDASLLGGFSLHGLAVSEHGWKSDAHFEASLYREPQQEQDAHHSTPSGGETRPGESSQVVHENDQELGHLNVRTHSE